MIVEQVRAVSSDIGVDAVKIGMLGDLPTIEAVREALALVGEAPIVLDPVMVAESGAILLNPAAVSALVDLLLPLTAVVTPNIPEARRLSGLGEDVGQGDLARAVLALGPAAAVVTGGHSEDLTDLFVDADSTVEIPGDRHPSGTSHGSGCTHSSALAAFLALGRTPVDAAREARAVASAAVGAGLAGLGGGAGPVDVLGRPHSP
jgi:hydroxymethylpyrimidine/phosphomethylpyrimidine kinase